MKNKIVAQTEAGINPVAIRSTLLAGSITLSATRAGLEPATATIASQPVAIESGLAR